MLIIINNLAWNLRCTSSLARAFDAAMVAFSKSKHRQAIFGITILRYGSLTGKSVGGSLDDSMEDDGGAKRTRTKYFV